MLERFLAPLLIDHRAEVAAPTAIVRSVDHGLRDLPCGPACGGIAAVLFAQQREQRREHPTELKTDGESGAHWRHIEEGR